MIILTILVGFIMIIGALIALAMLWRDGAMVGRVAMTGVSFVGTGLALAFIGVPFPIPAICGVFVAVAVWRAGRGRGQHLA